MSVTTDRATTTPPVGLPRRFDIIAAQWYHSIVEQMIDDAIQTLTDPARFSFLGKEPDQNVLLSKGTQELLRIRSLASGDHPNVASPWQDDQLLDIRLHYVAGCFEIPQMAMELVRRMLKGERHTDGIVTLGCLVQGETPHFRFIAEAVTNQLLAIGCRSAVPIGFGILTAQTQQQALERANGAHSRKGVEAAEAILTQVVAYQAPR